MKPHELALSHTDMLLASVRDFFTHNKPTLEETYPHDYLNEVDVEINVVHEGIKKAEDITLFNTLADEQKLHLLYYANTAIIRGLENKESNTVNQFRMMARGIGLLFQVTRSCSDPCFDTGSFETQAIRKYALGL